MDIQAVVVLRDVTAGASDVETAAVTRSHLLLHSRAVTRPRARRADAADAMSLHTVFCAECTTYFDWKSAGVFYSHRLC